MYLFAQPLWMPKAGNSADECDDACWPQHEVEGVAQLRFAVADGATETSFSGIWAKQLVRSYCRGEMDTPEGRESAFRSLQQRWWKIVRRKPLAWYAEEKLGFGTFSSLLGITFEDSVDRGGTGHWTAMASGDSCLVQIRNDAVVAAFPFQDSSAFSNNPVLLSTNGDHDQGLAQLRNACGGWESEDCFFLMTDALAAWFYSEREREQKPWQLLRDLGIDSRKPFCAWVASLREQRAMKNDDVTLYRISIG